MSPLTKKDIHFVNHIYYFSKLEKNIHPGNIKSIRKNASHIGVKGECFLFFKRRAGGRVREHGMKYICNYYLKTVSDMNDKLISSILLFKMYIVKK